jgi:hypothetical protein
VGDLSVGKSQAGGNPVSRRIGADVCGSLVVGEMADAGRVSKRGPSTNSGVFRGDPPQRSRLRGGLFVRLAIRRHADRSGAGAVIDQTIGWPGTFILEGVQEPILLFTKTALPIDIGAETRGKKWLVTLECLRPAIKPIADRYGR